MNCIVLVIHRKIFLAKELFKISIYKSIVRSWLFKYLVTHFGETPYAIPQAGMMSMPNSIRFHGVGSMAYYKLGMRPNPSKTKAYIEAIDKVLQEII